MTSFPRREDKNILPGYHLIDFLLRIYRSHLVSLSFWITAVVAALIVKNLWPWIAIPGLIYIPVAYISRKYKSKMLTKFKRYLRRIIKKQLHKRSKTPINWAIRIGWLAQRKYLPQRVDPAYKRRDAIRSIASTFLRPMRPIYKRIDEPLSTRVEFDFKIESKSQIRRRSSKARKTMKITRQYAYHYAENVLTAIVYIPFILLSALLSFAVQNSSMTTDILGFPIVTHDIGFGLFWLNLVVLVVSCIAVPFSLTGGLDERLACLKCLDSYFVQRAKTVHGTPKMQTESENTINKTPPNQQAANNKP